MSSFEWRRLFSLPPRSFSVNALRHELRAIMSIRKTFVTLKLNVVAVWFIAFFKKRLNSLRSSGNFRQFVPYQGVFMSKTMKTIVKTIIISYVLATRTRAQRLDQQIRNDRAPNWQVIVSRLNLKGDKYYFRWFYSWQAVWVLRERAKWRKRREAKSFKPWKWFLTIWRLVYMWLSCSRTTWLVTA